MLQKFLAEFFGTALLLMIVAGSGIMGESLSAGNAAVALLGNSIATGCGLYVLISLLGPISGAHFNPIVSLMAWRLTWISSQELWLFCLAQVLGAVAGIWLTHAIFDLEIMQLSSHARAGGAQMLSELLSSLVLLSVIYLGVKTAKDKVPMLVALTVTAGYWFTSSTFFANPAVTLARSLTNTFVGIAPQDVTGFIVAQLFAAGLFCAYLTVLKSQKA